MSKSRARFLSELLGTTGLVKKSKSALAGADEIIDLSTLPSIPNSKLTNSSITVNSSAVSLGGSVTLTTANVAENTNLYYTDARADARIAAADTGDLSEGSNLYFTNARADARVNLQTGSNLDLSSKDTGDLSEGSNLYYTNARADARIAAADTDDLSEGSSNLYYTDARADARVALVVDSAPSTLNTLNELAAALGDDANFSTTVTNSIAAKLPLAGGTITGTVVFNSAPTFNTAIAMGSTLNVATSIGIAGTTVIDSNRKIQNVTLGEGATGARFQANAWIYDNSGLARLYFEGNGRTFYRGETGHHFRANGDTTRLTISQSGGINLFSGGDTQAGTGEVINVAGTNILDSSRNFTNIGTISSGAITASASGAVASFNRTDNDAIIELKRSGSIKGYIGANTSGDIKFYNGSAAGTFTISSAGRVGINQTPLVNNFALQVTGLGGAGNDARVVYLKGSGNHTAIGSTGPTLVLQNTDSTANNIVKLSFESASSGETVSINAINTAHSSHYGDMAFNTRGSAGYSEKLRITSNGEIRVQNQTLVDSANTNHIMIFPNNKGISIGSAYTYGEFNANNGNVYIRANSYPANTGSESVIYLQTANSSGGQSSDVVVKGGKVGIGETNPDYQLHVAGAGDIKIEDTGAGSAHLHITSSTGGLRKSEWRLKTSGNNDEFTFDHRYTANDGSNDVVGNGTVLTLKSDANVDVTNDLVANNAKLKAIAESNTDTAVDVFVYDTRKDSDGGAWRKRTQHTSWYNETLNTSTRGARKEFPCVAVIVVETLKITIYDGDDPDMPMWMVFNADASTGGGVTSATNTITTTKALFHVSTLNSTAGLNGQLIIGTGNWHLFNFNFVTDEISFHVQYGNFGAGQAVYSNLLNGRNSAGVFIRTTSVGIITNTVKDVAMTVLPNAPIDAGTGLPVPTIAVGTNGGVSIIKDDGSVVDITHLNYTEVYQVKFLPSGGIAYTSDSSSNQRWLHLDYSISGNDVTKSNGYEGHLDSEMYHVVDGSTYNGQDMKFNLDKLDKGFIVDNHGDIVVAGSSSGLGGLGLIARNPANPSNGLIAEISSKYNTGWMPGGALTTKLATLSDTDTTNISASGNTNLLSGSWTNNASFPYETFTTSGLDITSAINTTAYGAANKTWTATIGKTYTAYFNLTLNSGTAPTLFVQTSSSFGNGISYQTVNGANSFTFTATMSTSSYFSFSVSDGVASNFSVSNLELYEGGVADHSINGKGVSVYGTVTKSAVATSAELVTYKPSSSPSSNYLCINETDWSIGTGDFSISFWWYGTSSGDTTQIYLGIPSTGGASPTNGFNIWTYGGLQKMYISGAYFDYTDSGLNKWALKTIVRRNGVLYLYENGVLRAGEGGASTGSINDQKFSVFYGHYGQTNPAGWMALLRISKTAPTEEQIKKMYNDEKYLFAENAKATIYGSSNIPQALAYDSSTDLVHVGTSAGRSVFKGLRRVDNTTDAVGTVIDASNGFIVEE